MNWQTVVWIGIGLYAAYVAIRWALDLSAPTWGRVRQGRHEAAVRGEYDRAAARRLGERAADHAADQAIDP